jgi:hypothetical protein
MSRLHPGLPNVRVTTSAEVYMTSEGPMHGIQIDMPRERFEEYRQGYRCMKCHAAQESAFPERCLEWYCRFPIAEHQLRLIEFEHRGEKETWSTGEDDDREREGWTPRASIWVPGQE